MDTLYFVFIYAAAGLAGIALLLWLGGMVYIPHSRVGVIEKLWSAGGSLKSGHIVATNGEAGLQTRMLRGGVHFGLFPWQYRIHKMPLVTVAEGRIAYVYAKDGAPLSATQTLARVVECNYFQDAEAFLRLGGERGRQRAILREGVFAINPALFIVIAEDGVYGGPRTDDKNDIYARWHAQLNGIEGFKPVLIGTRLKNAPPQNPEGGLLDSDNLGVVTVHDGPTIGSGEIIAPEVKASECQRDHNYFQDTEAFLELGGRRGRQLQVLTDGTFFINRWFATVEIKPKTIIPIGYVGVIVSYFGSQGEDITGVGFRYGEQVEKGNRGVWKQALPPGKYALNPYAVGVEFVPTVNFVLRWITGQAEAHRYDEDLTSIEIITADGYEPMLPLSLVLHIDYAKAPSVVQRFGDVKRLITQTLDPVLTAYFRDVAQSSHMLELLTHREEIQRRATEELGRRFKELDINVVAVLIGRPESKVKPGGEDAIERLFDQLRLRRLAEEQKETYSKQQEAAVHLKRLNEAQAAAEKQRELTQTAIDIEVAGNKGEAQLAEAQRLAKRDIARAEGESRSKELLGKGEASRIGQTGLAEAAVFLQKIKAYGDARLFALNHFADRFSESTQPLVPERVFMAGGKDGENGSTLNLVNMLLSMMLSEKSGIRFGEPGGEQTDLERFAANVPAPGETAPSPADPQV